MNEEAAEAARLEARIVERTASVADLNRLAVLKLAAGDAAGAVRAYRDLLIAGVPPQAGLYNNLGSALLRAGRLDEAIEVLQSALALQPSYLRARVNLGKALCEAGRIEESLLHLQSALAVRGDYVPALVNLGATHAAAGDFQPALAALEAAVKLEPHHIEALATLGVVRLWSGDLASAVAVLCAALVIAPEHADLHANLAHALFASGDWTSAWPHFEFRFRRSAQRVPLRHAPQMPRWDGIVRPDQELWLIGEQGLGDQLQFARYARTLAALGQRCVIACEPCLIRIIGRSELGADVRAFGAQTESLDAQWLPLMSAAHWHGTAPATVPYASGYLRAEPGRIDRWKVRLPRAGMLVALNWAGNARMETGAYAGRSPTLAMLEPLLSIPGIDFVSLQKGTGETQLDASAFAAAIHQFKDLDVGDDAFLDSAAILKCVDLLITSDTAVAHLAGALGVPTWLCLMREPDWRWMRDGSTTPWYRSLRLFRQPVRGDWGSVYRQIGAELARLRSSIVDA